MSICAQFLGASRKVAKQNNSWTDRACGVLRQGGDWFVVESYEGKIIWEGKAHCAYCARAEAISKMAGKELA